MLGNIFHSWIKLYLIGAKGNTIRQCIIISFRKGNDMTGIYH